MKQNCWEFMKCGRQPGGDDVGKLGTCAAPVMRSYDGSNSGTNAGRVCWRVSGTLYGGHADCTELERVGSCTECEFYKLVRQEEGVTVRV